MFESDGSRDECRGACVWVFDSRAHRSSHRRRSYPAQVSDWKSWLHEHQFQVGLCFLSCKHDETWIKSKDFHSLLFDVPCMFLSYPTRPGNQILKKFNLTLPPCRTVAIVGESGGGKISIYPSIHPSICPFDHPSIYHRNLTYKWSQPSCEYYLLVQANPQWLPYWSGSMTPAVEWSCWTGWTSEHWTHPG